MVAVFQDSYLPMHKCLLNFNIYRSWCCSINQNKSCKKCLSQCETEPQKVMDIEIHLTQWPIIGQQPKPRTQWQPLIYTSILSSWLLSHYTTAAEQAFLNTYYCYSPANSSQSHSSVMLLGTFGTTWKQFDLCLNLGRE